MINIYIRYHFCFFTNFYIFYDYSVLLIASEFALKCDMGRSYGCEKNEMKE